MNLNAYREQYKLRLKQKNLLYVEQIIKLVDNLMTFLKENHNKKQQESQEFSFNIIDFLIQVNVDKFDIFKLQEFIRKSEISKKVTLFANGHKDKVQKIQQSATKNPIELNENEKSLLKDISIIERIFTFITSLIKSDGKYSRLIINLASKLMDSSLKIVDIEPSRNMSHVLNDSLCFIFAGGTLEPISILFLC